MDHGLFTNRHMIGFKVKIIEIQIFLVNSRMDYRDMWIGRLMKREIYRL